MQVQVVALKFVRVFIFGCLILSGAIGNVEAEPCLGSAAACAMPALSSQLEDRFSNDLAQGRADSRFNGTPWLSQDPSAMPFLPIAAESQLKFQASTQNWSAFTNRTLAPRIEEAVRSAQQTVAIPKPPIAASSGLDLWSSMDIDRTDSEFERAKKGALGADYKLDRNTLVGVAAGFREDGNAVNVRTSNDHVFAAYMALKPLPGVTFQAKAEHAENDSELSGRGGGRGTHNLASARVNSALEIWQFKFDPAVSVSTGTEAVALDGRLEADKSAVELAPRLSRSFALPSSQTVEPFFGLKSRTEVANSGSAVNAESITTRSISGGLTVLRPDSYTLNLSTELERVGEETNTHFRSKMQLNIPFR
jgi:hypothetical protein